MMVCTNCGIDKPETDFYKGRRDCKVCKRERVGQRRRKQWEDEKERRRQWRAKNRDLHNTRCRERHALLKAVVYAAYGDKCACCGEDEVAFLSLDHVQGDGNIDRRNGMSGSKLLHRLKREGFPSTFQLLCMNCNFAKSHFPGGCPHGSPAGQLPTRTAA